MTVNSDLLAEHGHIQQFLLLSTLVPSLKDKLRGINVSKNYRSVCISSLVLKQFDGLIINLYGANIGFQDLQFAYQTEISANMCAWAVTETIGYLLRNRI